ncbi:hypothetical protein C8J57DRAFT_1255815 [Mycena rebaudengoi]|nr:hypothetical protein C8J57DRAFT_1255815 [Mycena rebaudengoi]
MLWPLPSLFLANHPNFVTGSAAFKHQAPMPTGPRPILVPRIPLPHELNSTLTEQQHRSSTVAVNFEYPTDTLAVDLVCTRNLSVDSALGIWARIAGGSSRYGTLYIHM